VEIERKFRVRLGANRAWVTIKGPRASAARSEYEYEIPCADAEEMLSALCNEQVIEGTHFLVPHDGLTWMIDVYGVALEGLVIAEIELGHDGQALKLPIWVGQEVTRNLTYKNTQLQTPLMNDREPGYASI